MALSKGEIWKEIRLNTGKQRTRYGVSNYGRVCSFKTDLSEKKLLKGTVVNGYPALKIKVNDADHQFYIHKLVADYFLKKTASKRFVIHKNHNKLNNKVSNLMFVSKQEMDKHQQTSPKVKQYRERIRSKGHKLNARTVKVIKGMIFSKKRKKLMKEIADQFGISEMHLYRIKSGENWSHIKI